MIRRYQTSEDRARAEDARLPIRIGRERLGLTQEELAEDLCLDPRTLRRYESGELPTPDDLALRVAELAGEPLLLYQHFKDKYRIGDDILPPVEAVPLAVAVVNLLHELEKLERSHVASRLLELASDGVIDTGEEGDFRMVMEKLAGVRRAVELMRYCRR